MKNQFLLLILFSITLITNAQQNPKAREWFEKAFFEKELSKK